VFGSGILFALSVCPISAAQSESLPFGDSSRALRKNAPEKKRASPRVYDNDNLPSIVTVSVVGSAGESSEGSDKTNNDIADEGSDAEQKKDDGEIKLGQSSEERQNALVRSSLVNRWKKDKELIWIGRIVSTNAKKQSIDLLGN
jgi:hypothetical protein